MVDSQDGAGLEVFLVHPLGLANLQDLCVAQVLQAALELVQRIRLESQRSHDLLPHHLHDLQRRKVETRRESKGEIAMDTTVGKKKEVCMRASDFGRGRSGWSGSQSQPPPYFERGRESV